MAEETRGDDHRDELPADLDVTGYVGPYMFPDPGRRRVAGVVYLAIAGVAAAVWLGRADGGVLVNGGLAAAAAFLAALGAYHLVSGWPLKVRETEALGSAAKAVGFPVGHASAQLGFRGLLSRPTWRILLYSADDPPTRRGLVLVDGVDAEVLGQMVEDNPEDWSEYR
jgi:hypothetical protein